MAVNAARILKACFSGDENGRTALAALINRLLYLNPQVQSVQDGNDVRISFGWSGCTPIDVLRAVSGIVVTAKDGAKSTVPVGNLAPVDDKTLQSCADHFNIGRSGDAFVAYTGEWASQFATYVMTFCTPFAMHEYTDDKPDIRWNTMRPEIFEHAMKGKISVLPTACIEGPDPDVIEEAIKGLPYGWQSRISKKCGTFFVHRTGRLCLTGASAMQVLCACGIYVLYPGSPAPPKKQRVLFEPIGDIATVARRLKADLVIGSTTIMRVDSEKTAIKARNMLVFACTPFCVGCSPA